MLKIYQISFIAAGISTILYLILVVVLSHLMKKNHYEVWENRLGSFSLITNNSLGNGMKFLTYFIFTNAFLELKDSQVTVVAVCLKVLFTVCAVLFISQFYLIMSGRV